MTSGRRWVTTIGVDGTPNVNVNNWAKKVRGSQILQQGALKLADGKVGQSSYSKILQKRFGVVKKFYKQQEGLKDKYMMLPFDNGENGITLFKTAKASRLMVASARVRGLK